MIPVCPKCHIDLIILRFKDVEVDLCQKCQGIWLDDGELQDLLAHDGNATQDPLLQFQNTEGRTPQGNPYLCPRCDSPMQELTAQTKTSELAIERCGLGHGLWFDAQELQQLLASFSPATSSSIKYLNEVFGSKPELNP
jgi:uncharacterized protein